MRRVIGMRVDPYATTVVASVGQLEALGSPVRMRILRHAVAPITVAELAERLRVPQTRLYYHINLLVDEKLLEQVDSRKSGARIERVYQRTAGHYGLGAELAESVGDARKAAEMAASIILEPARVEIEDSIEQVFHGGEPTGTFSRTVVPLSDEDFRRFSERFQELLSDISASRSNDEHAQLVALTAAFMPTERPTNLPNAHQDTSSSN